MRALSLGSSSKLRSNVHVGRGSNFPAHAGPMARLHHGAEEALVSISSKDRDATFSGTAKRLYPSLAGAERSLA